MRFPLLTIAPPFFTGWKHFTTRNVPSTQNREYVAVHASFLFTLLSLTLMPRFQAASFCSFSELWSRWSTPNERSKLVAFSFSGCYVGLTLSFPLSGLVACLWGWPAIFYVSGWWMIKSKNCKLYHKSNQRLMVLKSCCICMFNSKKKNLLGKNYVRRDISKQGLIKSLVIETY